MRKLKTKYKWKDRENHFAVINIVKAMAEERKKMNVSIIRMHWTKEEEKKLAGTCTSVKSALE